MTKISVRPAPGSASALLGIKDILDFPAIVGVESESLYGFQYILVGVGDAEIVQDLIKEQGYKIVEVS